MTTFALADQRHHVLNNMVMFPDVVCPLTPHAKSSCSLLKGSVYGIELCIERHHDSYQILLYWIVSELEHSWLRALS